MKFTLDRKIQLAFISCSTILLVVAIISFRNSEKFITASQWVARTHEVLYEFEQIQVQAIEAETGARGFIISGNEDYLEPFNAARLAINGHLTKVKQFSSDNPDQQKKVEQLEVNTSEHLTKLQEFIELRRIDAEKSKTLFLTGESRRILNKIRLAIREAKDIEESLLAVREKTSKDDAQNFTILFTTLLIIIGVVLVVVYSIIMVNLRALRRAENTVSIKNWNLTGTSALIKEMQGNKHVAELCPIIIRHVATYLKAELGAIYIADGNGGLKLMSSYAGMPVETNSRVIQFGEGLIGQSAAEKRIIALHDVNPQLYQMHTTFGYIKPKSVLAVPCVFEGKVLAAFELGITGTFNEQHLEYLQIVSDSVGIGLASSQAREEIKNLLEETQRQSEELETQQFELRQSNEALMMKSDLLEKSEVELKTQQEELQQTNVMLEEKATMLEEQKEKLQAAKSEIEKKAGEIEVTSKYKSEFLANMSHELRTPLNSVLILAQLLSENKNKRLGDKEIEYAKTIFNSGTDLLNLINEILDLSKIEAGKMQLDIDKISIEGILQNMHSLFSEMAINKGVEFVIEANMNELPAEIVTDKQRVEQVLRNLLSNAFKFTPNGGRITLYLSKTLQRAGKPLPHRADAIYFSVNDTGIGIPKDKRDIIFEAFQQADGSTKRQYGGTGLGLSISRELAHFLGGEILLESKEGVGSTFTLLLPINFSSTSLIHTDKKIEIKEKEIPVEPPQVSELVPIPEIYEIESSIEDDRNNILEGDRIILIIEDDENFANILLNVVRERKYKGIIALQGITGISYARHYKPDAIFLDMKMPVMNGMEVLTRLKNDPELRHIPVQIVSAFDNKKEMLELGAFNYIRKPVTSSDLQKAFEKIESFKSKKLKRLLIIEDNEQQNKAIRELIGNGDVKSFSAYSGMQAQKMLSEESFDCIIVDLGLPDMTGFELLEKIKANDKLNNIPIIVYTGRDLAKEETMRLNKLANTVVLKTANSHERLLDETILFLHRVESRLPKDKQTLIRKLHNADEVLKDKKILLVDDDVRNVYSLTNALEEEGLECVVAENGKVALELLKQNKDINLVLMDIMMPVMDGFEATAEIRKVDDLKKIPIIALTAKAMKGDKEKCLAVGMSDYISKPVNIAQLLSLMRVWLYQ